MLRLSIFTMLLLLGMTTLHADKVVVRVGVGPGYHDDGRAHVVITNHHRHHHHHHRGYYR